jgi:hypothetical protein
MVSARKLHDVAFWMGKFIKDALQNKEFTIAMSKI